MYYLEIPCERTRLFSVMLIQVDYGNGEFFVKNQTIYYQGVKVSPVNPTPVLTVGEYELYVMSAIYPLRCSFLVVIQSRYPAFFECTKVEMEQGMVMLTLTDGKSVKITPYRDGVQDRLLVNTVYKI